LILILVLNRRLHEKFKFGNTFLRSGIAAAAGGLAAWLVFSIIPIPLPAIFLAVLAGAVGALTAVFPILREIRLLVSL